MAPAVVSRPGRSVPRHSRHALTIASPALVLGALCALSCASGSGPVVRARYLMGTTCTVEVPDGPGADAHVEAAFEEIARVESLLSTWREESELSRVNRGEVSPGAELSELLRTADAWSRSTSGAFDPRVGALVRLWDLRGSGRIPDDAEIRAAEPELEEGAFGKGYALDRAIEAMRARGAARGLIDFGGQIAVFGLPQPIAVSIAHPEDRQRPFAVVSVAGGSVATTSGSERFFEWGGARYSHILDPRTGRALPPRGSVTVIHRSALVADILSTALYVMGAEEGVAWADARQIAVVFIVPRPGGEYELRPSKAAELHRVRPATP